MSDRQLGTLARHLRQAVAQAGSGGLTDAQLVEQFVRTRDETAFEVLVWRHGAMVRSVCRRVLRDGSEAEDAFQATFLILARKAATIRAGVSVAGWLYRVAYRAALRAREQIARHGRCKSLPDDLPAPPSTDAVWRDLRPVLDEEVNRLPEKYRLPVVLCYLEGHTNDEAARQLGCPRGTILSRLARGRERLRARLTRRGLALSAGAMATALAADASAAVPATVVSQTVGAAQAFVTGKAAGVVSAQVLSLTEGVLHAMFMTRIKLMGAAVLTIVVMATGAGLFAQREGGRRPFALPAGPGVRGERGGDESMVRGVLRSVDAAQHTLTLAGAARGRGEAAAEPDRTFTVAKDAEVYLDDGRARNFITRPGKLSDLAAGATVFLRLAADQKTVEAILAEGPTLQATLTGVDATKRTVTVAMGGSRGREGDVAPTEKTYPVSKTAEVVIDDGRGRRWSLREATLADLTTGCLVTLKLSPDQKEAVSIQAEGSTLHGTIKAIDPAKKTITLTTAMARGDQAAEENTYTVSPAADVLMEDDRPRRFFPVREAKLAELPVGAVAHVKLAPDQNTAVVIRAEGPTVSGTLKAVDPAKGVVILLVGAGRGSDGEEKSYSVAKDVHVRVDGAESKFADLKPSDPPQPTVLRLSVDQKAVRAITVGGGGR